MVCIFTKKTIMKDIFETHTLCKKELDEVTIYNFKRPNSIIFSVNVVTYKGTTSISGDLGNWIFAREFHPVKGEKISRSYYDEKLQMKSTQKTEEYSEKKATEEIEYLKEEYSDNDEVLDFLEELEELVYDKNELYNYSYMETPPCLDYEELPTGKVRIERLNLLYDAMDRMCDLI